MVDDYITIRRLEDDNITIRQTSERRWMRKWKWCERKKVRPIIKYRRILVNCLETERNDANLQTRKYQGLKSDMVPPDARQRRKQFSGAKWINNDLPCAHAPRHESAGSAQLYIPAALIAGKHETSSMALAETHCRSESVSEINNPRPFQGSKYARTVTQNSGHSNFPPSFAIHSSLQRPKWAWTTEDIVNFFGHNSPQWARASSFLMFLDHTQRRNTVGRTPMDEWSARRRDLYLTTHETHDRQTSMPPVGFEPTISTGERPQAYDLDSAATGTGK